MVSEKLDENYEPMLILRMMWILLSMSSRFLNIK